MRSIIVLPVLMMLLMLDVVVNLSSDEDSIEVPPGILGKCPAQNGYADYYQVTVMKSNTSLISGCAYIQHNPDETKRQAFSLWLSNMTSSGKRCRERNYTDMEHYHFNCLKKPLSPSDDTSILQGTYVRLYGPHTKNATKLMKAKRATKVNAKCAIFEVNKANSAMFLMAISKNVKCNGLLDMLLYPNPMKFEYSESNNGSMLLRLNRFKYSNGY